MAKKVNIEITNPVGLYASPATELVDAVKLYKSHVTLNYNEKSVNMKSLMGVLSLGIPHKAKIENCCRRWRWRYSNGYDCWKNQITWNWNDPIIKIRKSVFFILSF